MKNKWEICSCWNWTKRKWYRSKLSFSRSRKIMRSLIRTSKSSKPDFKSIKHWPKLPKTNRKSWAWRWTRPIHGCKNWKVLWTSKIQIRICQRPKLYQVQVRVPNSRLNQIAKLMGFWIIPFANLNTYLITKKKGARRKTKIKRNKSSHYHRFRAINSLI